MSEQEQTKETLLQLQEWEKVSNQLRELKKQEFEMRLAIADKLVPVREEGVNKATVSNVECKITQRINRTLDLDMVSEAENAIAVELGADTALQWVKGLIQYKPSLNLKNYRSLQKKNDAISKFVLANFNDCLVSKAGLPSLVIQTK